MATKDVAWLPSGLRNGGGWSKRMVQEAAAAAPFRGADDSLRLRVAVVATAALQSQ